LPVCRNKKIVGFISETDILSKFHPTMQEFSEDPFISANFEKMEEKAQEILSLKAQDIMSKRPITIKARRSYPASRFHDEDKGCPAGCLW
jgi:signal-transduction protein with cAMP-binding, CBS, and nucleotidyltransferase domain